MTDRDFHADMDTLRAEHESVRRHLEHARQIADSVGDVSVDELDRWLDHAIHTIAHQFLPHAHHEEGWLYARLPDSPGAPSVAAFLRRDHAEFAQLVDELKAARANVREPLPAEVTRELRRILYGMYAILKLHFAAEEVIYRDVADQESYRLRDPG
jgi:iron-sulfur cluster repair protein YtfE (RIC family)